MKSQAIHYKTRPSQRCSDIYYFTDMHIDTSDSNNFTRPLFDALHNTLLLGELCLLPILVDKWVPVCLTALGIIESSGAAKSEPL